MSVSLDQAARKFLEARRLARDAKLRSRKTFRRAHPRLFDVSSDDERYWPCWRKHRSERDNEPLFALWCDGCKEGHALRDEWRRHVNARGAALRSMLAAVKRYDS